MPEHTTKHIDAFITQLVTDKGFRRAECLMFDRSMPGATGFLSFPIRSVPRGFLALSCIVALRIEVLARWMDYKDDDHPRATFGTAIHFLRPDKGFSEWMFAVAGDLEEFRAPILHDLNNYAIPFLERNSSLPNLRKAVESDNSRDWIDLGLNIDSRVCVLAAIQIVEGDKVGAMRTLDEALAARKGERPKRWFDIQHLRRRLIEAG